MYILLSNMANMAYTVNIAIETNMANMANVITKSSTIIQAT